jgi:hypothetical protein
MEKIEILGPDGTYEEASVLDEAVKEQIKINERKRRRNGTIQEDEREAGELASDDMHGGGEDTVV